MKGLALRKKASTSAADTRPVSVCFKAGTRNLLTQLAAVRRFKGSSKPSSFVSILDDAVQMLVKQDDSDCPARFVPVPRSDCERVSLRVTGQSYAVAQIASKNSDVRITDWLRTAVMLYLRRHRREVSAANTPKTFRRAT